MSVLSVSRLISLSIRITDAADDDKYFSYLGYDKKEMLFLFASSSDDSSEISIEGSPKTFPPTRSAINLDVKLFMF